MGKLEIVPLEEVVKEVHDASTFRFRADVEGSPGQFVMVWIPGHDEVPMALSYLGDMKGITVRAYGDATKALLKMAPMVVSATRIRLLPTYFQKGTE